MVDRVESRTRHRRRWNHSAGASPRPLSRLASIDLITLLTPGKHHYQ